jgi:hypothetical protein
MEHENIEALSLQIADRITKGQLARAILERLLEVADDEMLQNLEEACIEGRDFQLSIDEIGV